MHPKGFAKRDLLVIALGGAIVALGVGLAFLKELPARSTPGPLRPEPPSPAKIPAAIDHSPALLKFKGDLDIGGLPSAEGKPLPFVVGEVVTLDVEARNVTEFRWLCDGQPLLFEGKEWTASQKREYSVEAAGTHRFRVEGRAASGPPLKPLEKELEFKSLKIISFESDLDPISDRFLTGETYGLSVTMVEPILEIPYRYRYWVNGQPQKNAKSGEEWSDSNTFVYTFGTPGRYTFKVEARRATSKAAEDEMSLGQTIGVGDAIIEYFDATPEHASAGSAVALEALGQSLTGNSEYRFGVQEQRPGENYTWLVGEDGKEWGTGQKFWTAKKAGNFRIRVETREKAGEATDFREIFYVVTEGTANF